MSLIIIVCLYVARKHKATVACNACLSPRAGKKVVNYASTMNTHKAKCTSAIYIHGIQYNSCSLRTRSTKYRTPFTVRTRNRKLTSTISTNTEWGESIIYILIKSNKVLTSHNSRLIREYIHTYYIHTYIHIPN